MGSVGYFLIQEGYLVSRDTTAGKKQVEIYQIFTPHLGRTYICV